MELNFETPLADGEVQLQQQKLMQGDHMSQNPRFEDTVILLDYDDTLLCSSWLASQNLRLDFPLKVPPEAMKQLKQLEVSVVKLVKLALTLGEVHIVTNAEVGWVELSAQRFLPGLLEFLPFLRVISARSTFEQKFPNQPYQWKVEAFRKQLQQAFSNSTSPVSNEMDLDFESKKSSESTLKDSTIKRNIVSLGDSIHEREALLNITASMNNTLSKSIKFVERPTLEQLQRQLDIVHRSFEYIFSHNDNLDLMLSIQQLVM